MSMLISRLGNAVVAALCLVLAGIAKAQETLPAGTFTSSLKTGVEPLTVTLTANLTNAFNCVASGAAAFTGARASTSGVLTLTETVTLKAGEVPKLTCDGRGFTALSWAIPTTNTDGSPLTDLYSFEIYQGSSASSLISVLTVAPTITAKNLTGMTRGTYYFGVKALAGSIAVSKPSAMSNIASKTVVPPTLDFVADVTVSKPPTIPNPPTGLTVADAATPDANVSPVFKLTSTGKRSPEIAGFVPIGTECSGNVLFYFREKPFRRVAPERVAWWGVVPSDRAAALCRTI